MAELDESDLIVGRKEIADRLGVKPGTVDMWRHRLGNGFPESTFTIGGRPAWRWGLVEAWATETGRSPTTEEE